MQLQGHNEAVSSVALSPDGSKIVSGSSDKTIRVWDASTGIEMLPPLQGHDDQIYSVAFSPDGSKSSLGLVTRPFEFGIQALALRCSHRCKATMSYDFFRRILTRWIQNHLRVK
jgi:predicted NACHT family NTPase